MPVRFFPPLRMSLRPIAVCLVLAAPLAACTTAGPQVQGYMIDEKALATVKPGLDAQKVLQTLGTPSTVSTVGNQTWYYISQNTTRTFMFQKPVIVDQRVIAVNFSKAMKVDHIENFGMKDGVIFNFNGEQTPTGGSEYSLLRQLFRAVGI